MRSIHQCLCSVSASPIGYPKAKSLLCVAKMAYRPALLYLLSGLATIRVSTHTSTNTVTYTQDGSIKVRSCWFVGSLSHMISSKFPQRNQAYPPVWIVQPHIQTHNSVYTLLFVNVLITSPHNHESHHSTAISCDHREAPYPGNFRDSSLWFSNKHVK